MVPTTKPCISKYNRLALGCKKHRYKCKYPHLQVLKWFVELCYILIRTYTYVKLMLQVSFIIKNIKIWNLQV